MYRRAKGAIVCSRPFLFTILTVLASMHGSQGSFSAFIGPFSPVVTVSKLYKLPVLKCLNLLYSSLASASIVDAARALLGLGTIPWRVYAFSRRSASPITFPWRCIRSFLGPLPPVVYTIMPLFYSYNTDIRLPASPRAYSTLVSAIELIVPFLGTLSTTVPCPIAYNSIPFAV